MEEIWMLISTFKFMEMLTSLDKGTQPFVVCDG